MKTLKSGNENGLTLNECIDSMNGRVAHYRVAGRDIFEHGYYTRGRSHMPRPVEGNTCCVDVYYMNEEGRVSCLCHNTKPHRASVLLTALKNGTINRVHDEIIDNYATNGYNTRSGLFRSNSKLERIKQVSRSHADYMGCESGNSTADHDNRVRMRN